MDHVAQVFAGKPRHYNVRKTFTFGIVVNLKDCANMDQLLEMKTKEGEAEGMRI